MKLKRVSSYATELKTTPARDKVFHFIRSISVRATPPSKGGEIYIAEYLFIIALVLLKFTRMPKGGFKKPLVAREIKLQIPLPLALTMIQFTNKDVENIIEKVINIEMTVNERLKSPPWEI
jgi:hypothetical protein